MKPKKVVDVRLVKVSFGKRRARAPKAFYNPVPPNKRLVEPSEQEQFMKDLEAAHAAALASDTSGNVQRYGSSTWLTALQTDSDSSSGSESDEVDDESDTSDSSSDQHRALYVTEATWSSSEELYNTCVCVTEERSKDIEVQTRGQSSCQAWFTERRKQVTATLCKAIVCRRKEGFTAVIRNKLSGEFRGNAATRYGRDNEPVAIMQYATERKKYAPDFSVMSSGLIINTTWPWLAASPDAIAYDPQAGSGVVEVKCPFKCQNQSLSLAVDKLPFLECCANGFQLNKAHAYYYQVQFQLLVTGYDWADFVVWTPTYMSVERVAHQSDFVAQQLEKLENFYFEHLLPALYAETV